MAGRATVVPLIPIRCEQTGDLAWATRSVSTAAAARYRQASEPGVIPRTRVVPQRCASTGADTERYRALLAPFVRLVPWLRRSARVEVRGAHGSQGDVVGVASGGPGGVGGLADLGEAYGAGLVGGSDQVVGVVADGCDGPGGGGCLE